MDPKDFEKDFIDKYKGIDPEDINVKDLFNGMLNNFLGMKGGKRGMQKNSLALIEQSTKNNR